MTAYDRERVEALLRERTEELRRMRRALHRDAEGGLDGELAHLDNHPADLAGETHDQEVDLTTEIFLEEEERRIEEARLALEQGTYGSCASCGDPIPAERLTAVPEAVRCIDCQWAFEGGHRQAHQGAR